MRAHTELLMGAPQPLVAPALPTTTHQPARALGIDIP